ncbi:MAG: superoxide dismutase [Rhodospirillaceae bacterium]
MDKDSRRRVLGTLGAGALGAGLTAASSIPGAGAKITNVPNAFIGKHEPVPLPFNARKLDGLSEKLITSHWENNYVGSVKALNMIESKLALAMADQQIPPLVYNGLKREELHRTGSVILHEIYFGSLGGNGKSGGDILRALTDSFGSFDDWRAEFIRISGGLGGGSGWVVLSINLHTMSLHNYWSADHMHNATNSFPLLALDMYEHSYHMDYGTAARRYVDAFMANTNWEVVDQRYQRALRMAAA